MTGDAAGPVADVDAWIARSAQRQDRLEVEARGPEPLARREIVLTVLAIAGAAMYGWALWQPWFLLFAPDGAHGGYETGWGDYGLEGGQLGRQGVVAGPFVVAFLLLGLDDLGRLLRGRRLRWHWPRAVVGLLLFLAVAGASITADPFGYQPLVLRGAVIGVAALLVVAMVEVERLDPGPRRTIGLGVVLAVGAFALSNLMQLNTPERIQECNREAVIDGYSSLRCTTAAHTTFVHGLRLSVVIWIAAWVLLVVGIRRWRSGLRAAPPVRPSPIQRGRRPEVVLAVMVVLAIASVSSALVTEVAATREWCTGLRPTRSWTRSPGCAADDG